MGLEIGANIVSEHIEDDSYYHCGVCSNLNERFSSYSDYVKITTEQFKKYILMKKSKYNTYRIHINNMLDIHKIACNEWKIKITNEHLSRMDYEQHILLSESDIDSMFKAATPLQREKLVEIFGEPAKPIELDKIKVGSKVKIEKYSGQFCWSKEGINFNEPLDVVFWKSRYVIMSDMSFSYIHSPRNIFHQNGKYCMFGCDNLNYITEVIEY
jgi:hypothetical protein